ncbi:hypothetical protein RJ641_022161 [Dillenia turbinata]|uniref:EF-hand domain-containing protein n=1 Tax=Dillenia turbinata TaxID=194707 RepID=A0AAN8UBU6_9MAGN
MTPADLMRAVVPVFLPSNSNLARDGYLRGERSPDDLRCPPSEIFMLFDVNKHGIHTVDLVTMLRVYILCYTAKSSRIKLFSSIQNGVLILLDFSIKKSLEVGYAYWEKGAANFCRDGKR